MAAYRAVVWGKRCGFQLFNNKKVTESTVTLHKYSHLFCCVLENSSQLARC